MQEPKYIVVEFFNLVMQKQPLDFELLKEKEAYF